MWVKIYVPDWEIKRIKGAIELVLGKKISIKKVANAFAQNLIDRYFTIEYLDTRKLKEYLKK